MLKVVTRKENNSHSLGVILGPSVSLEAQVALMAWSVFYQLQMLVQIHPNLDTDNLVSVAYALVISRLDSCKAKYIEDAWKL